MNTCRLTLVPPLVSECCCDSSICLPREKWVRSNHFSLVRVIFRLRCVRSYLFHKFYQLEEDFASLPFASPSRKVAYTYVGLSCSAVHPTCRLSCSGAPTRDLSLGQLSLSNVIVRLSVNNQASLPAQAPVAAVTWPWTPFIIEGPKAK